jgi:hypothetical protein
LVSRYRTIICFTIAAAAALAIGIVSGNHSVTSDGPREENRTIMVVVVVLAAVYRASTQAAPIVPMCIDAASHKVKGNEQTSDARISIGLSFFYLNYKLGFLVANVVLSTLPKRDVDRLLPSFVGAALIFFMTIGVTALSMPSGQLEAAEAVKDGEALKQTQTPTLPARPAMIVAADDIWLTVIRGSPRLKAVFVETICYGVAFGALSSIVAPFYNEVVFKAPPGASKGSACCKRTEPRIDWYLALKWLLKRLTFLPSFCRISSQHPIHYLPYPVAWMAYSGLISFAVEMVHDAVIGSLAFTAIAVDFGMTFFWVAELLIGAGLFVALYYITNKNAALVVFGMLVLASAAHGFFTLVACGALVSEPRLRPTAFGVRASCLHLGWLAGSVIAAFISDGARGFRPVMLMGALATQGASAAAVMVGSVERPRFSGVAVNANPLIKWVFRKEAAFNDREADVLECDSGGSAEWWMGRK